MQSRLNDIAGAATQKMSADHVIQCRVRGQALRGHLKFLGQTPGQPGVKVDIVLAEGDHRFANDGDDPPFLDEDQKVFPKVGIGRNSHGISQTTG